MSSNLSTEATGPASSSGNVGTGATVGQLKTDFANLLINRVTLGECLNVIRDACVTRASDIVDDADETQLENIKKDVVAFVENASSSGDSGNVGDGTSGPTAGATVGSAGETGSDPTSGPTPGTSAWPGRPDRSGISGTSGQ